MQVSFAAKTIFCLACNICLLADSALTQGQVPAVHDRSNVRGNTTIAQEPGPGEDSRLRDRIQKLETLVQALTHENDVLKKKLEDCCDNKPKG